jgi:hypothetical protein
MTAVSQTVIGLQRIHDAFTRAIRVLSTPGPAISHADSPKSRDLSTTARAL